MVELNFSSTSAMPDDGVPDMTRLTVLDEEVINKNLKVRYEKDCIYVSFLRCRILSFHYRAFLF
jgi:myosin heavy subunit